jgi:hypothetical protein
MKRSVDSLHQCEGFVLFGQTFSKDLSRGVSFACCLGHQTFCGRPGPLEQAAQDELGLQDGVHPPSSHSLKMPAEFEHTPFPLFLAP